METNPKIPDDELLEALNEEGEPILAHPELAPDISIKNEFLRKSLHLCSLSIPIIYYFIQRKVALEILIPLLVMSVFIDVGRHYIPGLKKVVNKAFYKILRPHERTNTRILLSGATYVLISATLCVLIFPKLITITAFAILIISDASSAIFGKMWGRYPFLDKSREGTIAFVLTAWLVVLVVPKAEGLWIEYVIGGIAAVVGAIVEAASVRLRTDDNLSIPISVGVVMWGFYYLLLKIDPAQYHSLWTALMNFD